MNAKSSSFFSLILVLTFAISAGSSSSKARWNEKVKKLKKYIKNNNFAAKQNGVIHTGVGGTDFFNISFSCDQANPTSVHQLRPQDIDVIGAMGDSITAANGANASNIPEILRQYQGMSWTIGGDEDLQSVLTIPNILQLFNPKLKGFSLGNRFDQNGDSGFNVAVPGAKADDMLKQAENLVKAMKEDSTVDFEKDWKLVTIFIGGNDLCDLDEPQSQPEKYIEFLTRALDYLHNHMRKTLVNVVNIIEIHQLAEVGYGFGSTPQCRFMQRLFCGFVIEANETEKEFIIKQNKKYQDMTAELINSGRYDTRDDFTIVLQPFLENTELPFTEDGQIDSTYFAPDCFHFSSKGHSMGALNLWNNMLEPVGQKSTKWSIKDLKCPTSESPYIFTNLNSRLQGSTTSVYPTSSTSYFYLACETEPWVIAMICVFAIAFFIQSIVLIILFTRRNKQPEKHLT